MTLPLALSLALAAPPAAPNSATLCSVGEESIFSCTVEGGKVLSMCMTGEQPNGFPSVQYRFGRPDAVELAYPEDLSTVETAFAYGRYTRPMVTYSGLKFTNKGVQYELFDDLVCDLGAQGSESTEQDTSCISEAGVTVTPAGGAPVKISCVSSAIGGLMGLEGLVPTVSFWR